MQNAVKPVTLYRTASVDFTAAPEAATAKTAPRIALICMIYDRV
jgi:hypothetical protein